MNESSQLTIPGIKIEPKLLQRYSLTGHLLSRATATHVQGALGVYNDGCCRGILVEDPLYPGRQNKLLFGIRSENAGQVAFSYFDTCNPPSPEGYPNITRSLLNQLGNSLLGVYYHDTIDDSDGALKRLLLESGNPATLDTLTKVPRTAIEKIIGKKRFLFDGADGSKMENIAFANGQTKVFILRSPSG